MTAYTVHARLHRRAAWVALVLCLLAALVAREARAQTGTSAAASGQLEEIIVTAQKRAENVQSVPITMQAFTAEDLKEQRVQQLTDVTHLAPNLNVVVQNALSQHVVIRGVGTNEFFGNAPSSVGMYMDEVTMNSSYMSTLGLFDMQRIEVLRGPQNSLFGRNTTGGAINYITNMPAVGGESEGYATMTYGRHNLMELEGGVSFPLGDKAAGRVAGIWHTRDGIWHNLDSLDDSYGDEDRYSVRPTVVWEPGDATVVTFSAHHARDRSDAQPQKVVGLLNDNPPLRINDLAQLTSDVDWEDPTSAHGLVNIEGFDHHTDDWNDVYTGGSQRGDLNVDGGYVKLTHDFGAVTLTSISAYDKTHAWYEEDNTANGNRIGGVNHDVLIIDMDQSYEQWTQELRLASNDDAARFRWISGIYFLTEDDVLAQNIRFGENGFPGAHPSAVGITPPDLFDVIPNPYGNTDSFSIHKLGDDSSSIYGQGDYEFTDRLTGTLGLRYTHDDKSDPYFLGGAFDKTGIDPATYYDRTFVEEHAAGLPNCVPKTDPGYIPFVRCADLITDREDLTNNELGGKLGLSYHTSDHMMVYGSYSRGFKSGKFDLEFLHTDDTPFPQRPLDPEILDVFEAGFKSTLADQSLLLNGAVFYNIWKDQQVFNVGVNGPEFFNLPESQIYGAELETQWKPEATWLVSGALGLLHTEITDATGIDFDLHQGDFQEGHELPLSPELTANGAIEKRFEFPANAVLLRVDGRYQSSSKVKFSPQVPLDEYDARFEMNLRATLDLGGTGKKEIVFFADNLTGEKYCLEIQDLRGVSGSIYCVPNEGETQFGLQATFGF